MIIPIGSPSSLFTEHLCLPNNQRILFSGAFGTGKTHFLREFFNDNNKYDAIHLYPVNYSVASNEDIFELIKYDVLFGLLCKNIELEKLEIPKETFLPYFLKNNIKEIIPTLMAFIPKVGKSLSDLAEKLFILNSKFDDQLNQVNIDHNHTINAYLKTFTESNGGVREEDAITKLICGLIEQIKTSNSELEEAPINPGNEGEEIVSKKETVLIIDDLDRIDPEHIFRIFNILAAHVDLKGKTNKFDFDKIILVCDIDNIRKIFNNRYGMDVDFSGYIDKYYSTKIFHYDLGPEIISSIDKIFQDIILENEEGQTRLSSYNSLFHISNIKFILLSLLEAKVLPIRVLKKIFGSHFRTKSKYIFEYEGRHLEKYSLRFYTVYDFLTNLYQDPELIQYAFKIMQTKNVKNEYGSDIHRYIEFLLPFLTFNDHGFKIEEEIKGTFVVGHNELNYSVRRDKNIGRQLVLDFYLDSVIKMGTDTNVNLTSAIYFELLTIAIENIIKGKVPE